MQGEVAADEWLGRLDSNQGMAVPKTAALPLGYAPTGRRKGRKRRLIGRLPRERNRDVARTFGNARYNATPRRYSPHTASSLPAGSRKWKRRPPGKEKIGLTILPPADFDRRKRFLHRFGV